MSWVEWRVFVAAVAWLALIGAAPSNDTVSQAEHTKAAHRFANSTDAIARESTKRPEPSKAMPAELPCKEGYEDRQSELCAQWKAADAAREAACWAMWSFVATTAGLVGLLLTIRQGQKGLSHARHVSHVDMRPWLKVSLEGPEVKSILPITRFQVTAKVENVGRTAAQRVEIVGQMLPSLGEMERFCDAHLKPRAIHHMIMPQSQAIERFSESIPPGTPAAIFAVCVTYGLEGEYMHQTAYYIPALNAPTEAICFRAV